MSCRGGDAGQYQHPQSWDTLRSRGRPGAGPPSLITSPCAPALLQLFWGAPPRSELPQGEPRAVPGAAQPGCGGAFSQGWRVREAVLEGDFPLRVKSCQQSPCSPSASPPVALSSAFPGGRGRHSTEAPDSHFLWLFPFSHPPHHLWLCLPGTSAHNSIALRARRNGLTNSQQRNSVYRELGVWEGGAHLALSHCRDTFLSLLPRKFCASQT